MQSQDRLHSFDAVRAFALLSGLVLHTTMSFTSPLPAPDRSQSVTLGVVLYVIHMFRMSTFYFIAGFFGRMLFHRIGFKAFVKDRSKRILVPLVIGWIILAPLLLGAVIWGAIRTYGLQAVQSASSTSTAFPLTHLWFLYYLSIFYVLALSVRWCFDAVLDRSGRIRICIDKILRVMVNSDLGPILFAAPIWAVLYFSPDWPVWFGIPTPDYGLTPKIRALILFGTAFGVGWLMHRQMDLLGEWQRRWHIHFSLAAGLTILCLYMVGLSPNLSAPSVIAGPAWTRLAYAACYTLAIWYWVFAIVGGAMRFLRDASPVRRYVADSSYWLYLIHLPIIFYLQVAVMKWSMHWSIKFTLILAITLTLTLVSYHYFVRYTFIGSLLNGRRRPRLSAGV